MSEGYLRPNTLLYPQQPNPSGIYAVHIMEDKELRDLEDAVNQYLFDLPDPVESWQPHLVDTQLMTNGEKGKKLRWIMKITIFASGTITSPPT